MIPILIRMALVACILTVSACAGVAKRNTSLYSIARDADTAQANARSLAESNASAARASAIAALAARCAPGDTACITALGANLVMSDAIAALGAAARPAQTTARAPYERDGAAKFGSIMLGLTPLASIAGNTWLGIQQSNNTRKITLGDQATERSIVDSIAELGAQPTTVAGGDVIGGDRVETNIADSYNDSSDNSTRGDEIAVNGDGSAVGEGNDTVNGDNANNSGNIGTDNRQDSPGPFDDHSCDAAEVGCDGTITPPPVVEPGA